MMRSGRHLRRQATDRYPGISRLGSARALAIGVAIGVGATIGAVGGAVSTGLLTLGLSDDGGFESDPTGVATAPTLTATSGPTAAPGLTATGGLDGLEATVVTIIDGDTIEIDIDGDHHTVRLLGIDAPEKPGSRRPAECFGEQAREQLSTIIPPQSVVLLTRDIETRDQYGRLLTWVHRPDGLFVNRHLIDSGHATPLFFPPNDRLENEFVDAGHRARRDQVGFWLACGGPDIVVEG